MNSEFIEDKYKFNPNKWVRPQIKVYNPVKKYSLLLSAFVFCLIFISILKNETRKIQKEINELQSSLSIIKITLHEAVLDNELLTSPSNINLLAKKYLESNYTFYKKSQIKRLNENVLIGQNNTKEKKETNISNSKHINEIKIIIAKKIATKKMELRKLQKIYSEPEKLPEEIKIQVAKKIKDKKAEIKQLYSNPKDAINTTKIQKWAAVQLVKAFLGIPIIPGK